MSLENQKFETLKYIFPVLILSAYTDSEHLDQLRCICLRSIKKNIREEELPTLLVVVNPNTGQSVDKDLPLKSPVCMSTRVRVLLRMYYNNTRISDLIRSVSKHAEDT